MDKNEYLARVFESQVESLKANLKNYKYDHEQTTAQLRELNRDIKETEELIKLAETELRKYKDESQD